MAEWHWPRYAVKVTVVEILGTGVCPAGLKVGDSWVWRWAVPEGLCPWMARSLYPEFQALTFGGNIPWEAEEGKARHCCGDPRSPVVVEVERLEAMSPSELLETV